MSKQNKVVILFTKCKWICVLLTTFNFWKGRTTKKDNRFETQRHCFIEYFRWPYIRGAKIGRVSQDSNRHRDGEELPSSS